MIIGRIQIQDCETFSVINQKFSRILEDPSQSWIQSDFISNNFFQQSGNDNTQTTLSSQKSVKLMKQFEKRFSLANTESSPTKVSIRSKKLKKSQRISVSFTNQNLTKWKKIVFVSFICFLSIIFFGISNLIIYNYNNVYNEPSMILHNSQLAIENIMQMKTFSQILSNYRYITSQEKVFPDIKLNSTFEIFDQASNQVREFIPYFLNDFQKFSEYSASQTNYLRKIFQENLCQSEENNQQAYFDCAPFTDSQIQLFQGGVLGIISRYIYVFNQYKSLFQNDHQLNLHLQILEQYIEDLEYFDLFVDKSQEIIEILDHFKTTISNICSDFTSQLSKQIQIYFIILGPIIFIIQIITILYVKAVFLNQLRSITFGLTLIPYSKMQEESTLQIIKQLLQQ